MSVAWLVIGYGVVSLTGVRPLAGALAWHWHRVDVKGGYSFARRRDGPSGEQWFGAICLALLLACVWPMVVAFLLQGRRDSWTIGAERLARLEAREERVKRMERELEVGSE